jgi:hypothetical protein
MNLPMDKAIPAPLAPAAPALSLTEAVLSRRRLMKAGVALAGALVLAGCKGKPKTAWKPLTQEELDGPPRRTLSEGAPHRASPAPLGVPQGVTPRREWTTAGPIMSLINPMNGVNRITIHHSGVDSGFISGKPEAARMLNSIRKSHLQQQWADIGYHYIIDPTGRIWEGRPVQYQGAHVKMNNEHNLGIMVMGNFDSERPSAAALSSLDRFVADRMRQYRVPMTRVYTHQEIMATACPGRNLQGYMMGTRSGSGRMYRAFADGGAGDEGAALAST